MRFRTEIELHRSPIGISHSDRILLLGSCFTDHIGQRLAREGFNVLANPFGPFFNPASIARILDVKPSLTVTVGEQIHCLDLPSKYQSEVAKTNLLAAEITSQYAAFQEFIKSASVAIITLGSAHIYRHIKSDSIVANCHKLPASEFDFSTLSLHEAEKYVTQIVKSLKDKGVGTIIFTISPVRHLDRGLEGNFVSKATLRLAIQSVRTENVLYFPAFEILNDDLRDYRFYAADMKHPSEVAVDYIYQHFAETFFSRSTKEQAAVAFKEWQLSQHRTILK